jgi:putative cell wall-binding protein
MGLSATLRWLLASLVCILPLLTAPARAQETPPVAIDRVAGPDRVATAVAVSRDAFDTAGVVVLASADGYADALAGAPLAARWQAPLLLTPSDRLAGPTLEEIQRLGVRRVVLLGGEQAIAAEVEEELRTHVRRVARVSGIDRYETAVAIARLMPSGDRILLATGAGFPDGLAAGALAGRLGLPVLLTPPDRLPPNVAAFVDERDPGLVTIVGGRSAVSDRVAAGLAAEGRDVERIAGGDRFQTALRLAEASPDGAAPSTVWIANGTVFPDALAAGPAVATRGGVLLLVDGEVLRRVSELGAWLRAREAGLQRIVLLGGPRVMAADAPEQVESLLAGVELPMGGRSLFPEFRLVALYGHSRTPSLGVLGEQPPDAAADRAVRVAAPYDRPERPAMPAFEFIATVATASPGPSGLYRQPTDPEVIRRSLDAIRRVGGYLVLDIQPGRSDFLTESKRYAELLAEPDVGLALDPEWRMGPNEKPGDRVGSVHASEINSVSAWLADLVAAHRLPEKMLLLHQFQTRMIRDRHLLEPREGLAITVQMDGFGSRAQKIDTYSHTRIEPPFWNGFKLFYDEDSNLFQPDEVIALDPTPDWVSYQ